MGITASTQQEVPRIPTKRKEIKWFHNNLRRISSVRCNSLLRKESFEYLRKGFVVERGRIKRTTISMWFCWRISINARRKNMVRLRHRHYEWVITYTENYDDWPKSEFKLIQEATVVLTRTSVEYHARLMIMKRWSCHLVSNKSGSYVAIAGTTILVALHP